MWGIIDDEAHIVSHIVTHCHTMCHIVTAVAAHAVRGGVEATTTQRIFMGAAQDKRNDVFLKGINLPTDGKRTPSADPLRRKAEVCIE